MSIANRRVSLGLLTVLAAFAGIGVVAYRAGYANAAGIPSPTTLAFSGSLLTFGTPDNATHQMSVALFVGTTQECITPTGSVTCVNGQFTIPLTTACVTAIQTYANVDAQVTVDGVAMGMNAVTAVPYAVIAGNATGNLTPLTVTSTGPLIRQIARAHGLGPDETGTSGALASRVLSFTKTTAATGVRVTWEDSLRCTGNNVSCRWEIEFDGASCTNPGPLIYDIYLSSTTGDSVNNHRTEANLGTCFGLAAGTHTIQVYMDGAAVGSYGYGSAGSPFTGWNSQYWSLEAEEVY